jgi:hypothetical protein
MIPSVPNSSGLLSNTGGRRDAFEWKGRQISNLKCGDDVTNGSKSRAGILRTVVKVQRAVAVYTSTVRRTHQCHNSQELAARTLCSHKRTSTSDEDNQGRQANGRSPTTVSPNLPANYTTLLWYVLYSHTLFYGQG